MSANIFTDDLRWSETQHTADWWSPYYLKAFPQLTSIETVRGPSLAQKAGIDKFVIIRGKRIAVDEKIRRNRPPTDIALELRHVPTNGEMPWDGWLLKSNQFTDYLAVGFAMYRTAFFFPFLSLQAAWLKHGDSWCSKYGVIKAPNPRIEPRYHTESVCVPTTVLMGCLLDAMRIVL